MKCFAFSELLLRFYRFLFHLEFPNFFNTECIFWPIFNTFSRSWKPILKFNTLSIPRGNLHMHTQARAEAELFMLSLLRCETYSIDRRWRHFGVFIVIAGPESRKYGLWRGGTKACVLLQNIKTLLLLQSMRRVLGALRWWVGLYARGESL